MVPAETVSSARIWNLTNPLLPSLSVLLSGRLISINSKNTTPFFIVVLQG